MAFCTKCGSQLTSGAEKFCPNCGYELSKGERVQTHENRGGINISGTHRDVSGVGVSGSSNVVGKNIVIGSGTISLNEQQLENLPDKYAEGLKTFSKMLNQQLKIQQVPEDKVNEVNETLNDFAKEVQDVKPGEEKNIDPGQKPILNGKFRSIIRSVLRVIPTVARIGSSLFAPLAPFSSLIGETVDKIVADYMK